MEKPSLLILAAGLGSRYGGFKQIDPIGPSGEVIIDYSIFDAVRAGFGRIVIVTAPALEKPLREHFAKTLGDDIELVFVFQKLDDLPNGFSAPAERQKPWGTAHAIWSARAALDGAFGVINADDFYGKSSFRVLHDFLANKRAGEFALVGFELAKTLSAHGTVSRGICRGDADGYLINVVEHTKIEPDAAKGARSWMGEKEWQPLAAETVTSMNMWGFDGSLLRNMEDEFRKFLAAESGYPKSEFFIPTVVDALIQRGLCRCKILKTSEQWFGVTYQEDRAEAARTVRELTARGIYPASLARN